MTKQSQHPSQLTILQNGNMMEAVAVIHPEGIVKTVSFEVGAIIISNNRVHSRKNRVEEHTWNPFPGSMLHLDLMR